METLDVALKKHILPKLKKEFKYAHILAAPRIQKVVVNMGIGRITDGKEREEVRNMLALITAQRPEERRTNKSIATFKTRAGMVNGYRVTLRGKRMYAFLDKLIHATLPRTRDFRGIPLSSVDAGGNLNIGIREHIIFPELVGEDFRRIYSLQVTVVTLAGSRTEALALYRHMGVPLEKAESEQ